MCGIPHRIVSVICNPFKLGFQYVSGIFLQFDCVVVTTQYKNKTAIRTSDCDLGIKVALQTASAKHTESFVSSLVPCPVSLYEVKTPFKLLQSLDFSFTEDVLIA